MYVFIVVHSKQKQQQQQQKQKKKHTYFPILYVEMPCLTDL